MDYVTTVWGGGAFVVMLLLTRRFVVSFGMMSPVIAGGIVSGWVRRAYGKD